MTTTYVTLHSNFKSYLSITFAKVENSENSYFVLIESMFGDPYTSTAQDSLVFRFEDNTTVKLMHEHSHNPIAKRTLHVLTYYSYHTFEVSEEVIQALSEKVLRSTTLYFTGASGISFDHLPKRQQRKHRKRAGQYTYDMRHIKKKQKRKIQELAHCILQAKVPSVKESMTPRKHP